MTADTVLYDLDSLYLEIDPRQQDRAWQQAQMLSTPHRRWSAYLNQLGLTTFLSWLDAEGLRAKTALAAPLQPTVWELVTGSAIECQGARLIVLPTETLDSDELRVPQTWVDIPSWVGDYYLLLQVNPDAHWVRFAGFATHQDLKMKGDYDWRDRTYSLEATALTTDINVLQVAQEYSPETLKRAAVEALSDLSVPHAHQLIERLADPTLIEPRLAIGFGLWGALLAHGGWRRQLAERRWGRPVLPLRQWLQSGVDQLANQLGWQQMTYQPVIASARSVDITTNTAAEVATDTTAAIATGQPVLCRDLDIEGERYSLQVMPLATADATADNAWRFELTKLAGLIAPGVTLRLLTEDLQPFENNQAIATEAVDSLYIDVSVAEQEGLVWNIQPAPSQYEPEILRF